MYFIKKRRIETNTSLTTTTTTVTITSSPPLLCVKSLPLDRTEVHTWSETGDDVIRRLVTPFQILQTSVRRAEFWLTMVNRHSCPFLPIVET